MLKVSGDQRFLNQILSHFSFLTVFYDNGSFHNNGELFTFINPPNSTVIMPVIYSNLLIEIMLGVDFNKIQLLFNNK